MTTCKPSCIWWKVATTSASSSVAVTGPLAQATTAARGWPARCSAEKMNHTLSSTSAIAVARCAHQCVVPDFAEPSPRARPSMERMIAASLAFGCAMSMTLRRLERYDHNPGEHGQHRRRHQHRAAGGVHLGQFEPVPEIPEQMPDAIAEME